MCQGYLCPRGGIAQCSPSPSPSLQPLLPSCCGIWGLGMPASSSSAVCSGSDCRAEPGAGAPGTTVPIPACSSSTGAVSAAAQKEYLSLLLELPFNTVSVPWPCGAGVRGRGLAALQHRWLREDAVLWVHMSLCRGMAVSPCPSLRCGNQQPPKDHPQHLVWSSQHCTGAGRAPRGCGDEDVAEVSPCHGSGKESLKPRAHSQH